MWDQVLKKYGLKYEDLNAVERETFGTMIEAVQQTTLTVEKIKDSIIKMRQAVDMELASLDNNDPKNSFLKARLRNYILLEALLTSPDKAKQQLEQALAGVSSGLG